MFGCFDTSSSILAMLTINCNASWNSVAHPPFRLLEDNTWQGFWFICWLCGLWFYISTSALQQQWWEAVSWNPVSSHLATVLQQLRMTQWVTPLSSQDTDCPAVCYPSSWRLDRQGHGPASVNLRHDPACISLWLSHCSARPHSWHLDTKDHVISQQECQLRIWLTVW